MATYKLVDSDQLDANLTTVADAIRAKTGGTDPLSFPDGMAEAVEGISGDSYYDTFWDEFQENGAAKDYSRAFGPSWTVDIFKPKYSIIATNAYMLFAANLMQIDLVEYLDNLGSTLDVSQATNTMYMFQSSNFTRVGIFDARGSTNSVPLDNAFANCYKLVTIDKIYLKTGSRGEFNITFNNCPNLENVLLEGEITADGLNMKWSKKLSKDSILSVINALSATSTDKTITLSLTAVNNAFETAEGAADGSTSEEWTTLIATKSNWTISLVDA